MKTPQQRYLELLLSPPTQSHRRAHHLRQLEELMLKQAEPEGEEREGDIRPDPTPPAVGVPPPPVVSAR